MRSLPAAAVLIAITALSGCNAAHLDATDTSVSSSPSVSAPVPTRATSPAAPTTSAAPATTAPTHSSGTPTVTAVATNTANAGSGSTSGVPMSYAAASARLDALRTAPHRPLDRFSTTGDAVYCVLHSTSIPTSCELRTGAIPDAGVCGQSMADSVGRIQLGDDGAVPECNTDTIREPGATVVAAPAVVTYGSLACAVERIGVTCVNTRTRAGFFLTPGKYATFS